MDTTATRTLTSQLSEDLAWLEQHSRQQHDHVRAAAQLRLAAALVRNCIGPLLNEQPAVPLHIAVVGGAGTGKSTVANLLSGTANAAEANAQAGFTRHPVAFTSGNGPLSWTGHYNFLGPLRRLDQAGPSSLDQDVYQIRRVPADPMAFDLLKDFVVWDCPDMTTWAASGYINRLIEVASLADVVVYVASDERYNDEVPTQFLQLLLEAGKPVVACLTKMRPADAQALVHHFQMEVVGRMPQGVVGVLTIPFLTPAQLADTSTLVARYRIPLLNQVAVLGSNPNLSRRRTVLGANNFLVRMHEQLLAVARHDLAALESWQALVRVGQVEFDARYQREYLTSEKFSGFDQALVRLMELLELPGIGKAVSGVLHVLRTPYRLLSGWLSKAVTRPEAVNRPETAVLEEAFNAWVDQLRKEAAHRNGSHPLWTYICQGFHGGGLAELMRERFQLGLKAFHAGQSAETERTARAIYEELEKKPAMLNTLRGTKFALDAGAIVATAVTVGTHVWMDVFMVPLVASITHQLVELMGQQYVAAQREETRNRLQLLMVQSLSAPLAEWLAQWPSTGGSSFERLQLALRRTPKQKKRRKSAALQNIMADTTAPLLRTLSPALRGLEGGLRGWLDAVHRYPLGVLERATLEGLAADLKRQADALDVDRPLLVIMLMGGTGVGKSTLLNALAGGAIAVASVQRPTTRDPVVYYHESIRHERLDPALRYCRLVPHSRSELIDKVIVDTPDLDSTHQENRKRVVEMLPIADVILYVGSQEKYHDRIGWEVFLEHRKRRAFAFVLNKWDRCTRVGASGLRPDEDLLRDLEAQGFQKPLLFRTCAQLWLDQVQPVGQAFQPDSVAPVRLESLTYADAKPPPDLPQGEQFQELVRWLELGLTRLEIEAIKSRGVGQMLEQMQTALEEVKPPELGEAAERVRLAWQKPLAEEASVLTEVLLNTLEPYQHEIELHFSLAGQRRFRGPMAAYLGLVTRLQYAGSTLRDRFSLLPRTSDPGKPTVSWNLDLFKRACSEAAGTRQVDSRMRALANHLLVEADLQGFPVELLTQNVEGVARLDWHSRHEQALTEVLQQVERQWTSPQGQRRFVHALVMFLANWMPGTLFVASLLAMLWWFFDPMGSYKDRPTLSSFLLPLVVLIAVLIVLHILIALLLPLHWASIRDEFKQKLEQRLRQELQNSWLPVAGEVVEVLKQERHQVEKLAGQTREVGSWLAQREQASSIAGLYGN